MLRIIKKDGRFAVFEDEKIRVSIANTAEDINFMLNKRDIDVISKEIKERIIKVRGEDGITSSYEIISLVLESLHNMGFTKVADSFYKGTFGKLAAK